MDTPSSSTPNNWNMLCHLSALSLFVGLPLGNLIGPLVIWLWKKDQWPSVDEHGKEALNFQISWTLYLVGLAGATFSLMLILVGFLLVPVLIAAAIVGPVLDLVFIIIASIQASQGKLYRYPATIRFLK